MDEDDLISRLSLDSAGSGKSVHVTASGSGDMTTQNLGRRWTSRVQPYVDNMGGSFGCFVPMALTARK